LEVWVDLVGLFGVYVSNGEWRQQQGSVPKELFCGEVDEESPMITKDVGLKGFISA
jgi:hypothetical protein